VAVGQAPEEAGAARRPIQTLIILSVFHMHVTLCTYNIHSWKGRGGKYDPQLTLQVLSEIGADVYALQEFQSAPHELEDMVVWVGKETGLHPIPGPTLLRQKGTYGNVVLTRLPASDIHRMDISVPGREPRGALDIRFRELHRPLRIVATHLGLAPKERRAQMLALLELFKEPSSEISILMGDLNEWYLWGRPLHWLRSWFGKIPEPATFPACFPIFALDRIWVHPLKALLSIHVHDTPLARRASDHLPLKAVIQV
jgi:endonuclease/exonuclease/phosphatase family metal-dependent hydrolase